MIKVTTPLAFAVAVILAPSVGLAGAERGTPAEAKAMLQKAVAHYKAVGRTHDRRMLHPWRFGARAPGRAARASRPAK